MQNPFDMNLTRSTFAATKRRVVTNLPDIPDFSETLSHDVNVVDVEEHQLHVFVKILVLVTAAGGHVGHRVHLRPSVHDEDAVGLRVGIHDLENKRSALSEEVPRRGKNA